MLLANSQVSDLFVTGLILNFRTQGKAADPEREPGHRSFYSFQRAVNSTKVFHDEMKVAA